MDKHAKILVLGHNGLVGSALVRHLRLHGYDRPIIWPRKDIGLRDPAAVKWAFSAYLPEYVFLCAAKVGGIQANASNQVEFFVDNMAIETNVLMNASEYGVRKLVFLGSSCIYPKECPQPIKESYLLTGPIEPTTEPYALAKVSGVRLCQWLHCERGDNFVSAMPCNLFGTGDNFHEETAHIIPGMMARMHRAKVEGSPAFKVWGDGTAQRELLFAEDLAEALLVVMRHYEDPTIAINTGSGLELTVAQIAKCIARVVGYEGQIQFDPSRLTGTQRKILDNTKIFKLGWSPKHEFFDSLRLTYAWYCASLKA